MDPIRINVELACSPTHAFDVWTRRIGLWWPASHTVSGDPVAIVFERHPGGRIYERTRDGAEHDWGEVVTWDPPRRLIYRWHLMFEPTDATTVDITFTGQRGSTTVSIVHGGWDALGEVGPARRDRNRHGWAGLLPHYREAIPTVVHDPGGRH